MFLDIQIQDILFENMKTIEDVFKIAPVWLDCQMGDFLYPFEPV